MTKAKARQRAKAKAAQKVQKRENAAAQPEQNIPRGQFDPDVNIYEYMEQTAPYASCVRAKIYKIDSGREEWLDYPRIIEMLYTAGFNGNVSICFEGGDRNRCDAEECLRLATHHLREVIADVYG